ncbi:hypothetical protein [Paraburkholderia caribensis]|uniref:hypothetical protein n=1 Tax=Paraburkholderia caribensis TaxID=75105 RepID=UPI00285F865F|nr:hypothetical protein [Paraburkholderia caribensis]MDR6381771.1 hypothetical protein [Paraburkholderia caribensis]
MQADAVMEILERPAEVPDTETIARHTVARAERVMERCSYIVTGYVMQHRLLQQYAVIESGRVRWYPNDDEFQLMMTGRKLTPGPGVPPPEAIGDDLLAAPLEIPAAPAIVLSAPTAARPTLTAPPSAKLLETTEAALGELARELGCVFNEDIPHNAGWFVPGKARAHASAYDAIRGLFASLEAGGTVYRAPVPSTEVQVAAPKPKAEPQMEAPQGALF